MDITFADIKTWTPTLIQAATSVVVTVILVPIINFFTERKKQRTEIFKALYTKKLESADKISTTAAALKEAATNLFICGGSLDKTLSYDEVICSAENRGERILNVHNQRIALTKTQTGQMKNLTKQMDAEVEFYKSGTEAAQRKIKYTIELLVEKYIKDGITENLARLRAESEFYDLRNHRDGPPVVEGEPVEDESAEQSAAEMEYGSRNRVIDAYMESQDRFIIAANAFQVSYISAYLLGDTLQLASSEYINAVYMWAYEKSEGDADPQVEVFRRLEQYHLTTLTITEGLSVPHLFRKHSTVAVGQHKTFDFSHKAILT